MCYFNHGFRTAWSVVYSPVTLTTWLGRIIPYVLYIVGQGYSDRGAVAVAVRNAALSHCALDSPFSRQ
jgi:hypothetical protein